MQGSYRKGGYVYVEEHLPPNQGNTRAYSAEYFIAKAGKISPEFKTIIEDSLFVAASPSKSTSALHKAFSLHRSSDPALFRRAYSTTAQQRVACDINLSRL